MQDYGIKISLPGYDVLDATPEQCVVHSTYPSPKIQSDLNLNHYSFLTINFLHDPPTTTDTVLYSVAHGYNYTPMVLASGSFSQLSPIGDGPFPLVPTATLAFFCRATSTTFDVLVNVDIGGWGSLVGSTLTVSYYIFCENGV